MGATIRPLDAEFVAGLLPERPPASHKGTFGTLVCVCGSLDYAGAALLAGMAAVRAGAGLVTLAVPRSLQAVVAGRVPEVTTLGLPEAAGGDIDPAGATDPLAARSADALVFGCGIAETAGYGELLVGLLADTGPPLLVDGGGLNLLARSADWWRDVRRELVLTPHPGEFGRLTGAALGPADEERSARCAAAASDFGAVVVLKGARTVVCAPDGRRSVAPFANAALATAGTGDVLAGTIGALLAQGAAPFDAACLGAWLHGQAAERISDRLGAAGLAASDLPLEIAAARADLVRVYHAGAEAR
jgi:ADP-dependent NAD(P)H-hydrate dehydratase / NAD(P)H-hydrate epimerase